MAALFLLAWLASSIVVKFGAFFEREFRPMIILSLSFWLLTLISVAARTIVEEPSVSEHPDKVTIMFALLFFGWPAFDFWRLLDITE